MPEGLITLKIKTTDTLESDMFFFLPTERVLRALLIKGLTFQTL